MTRAITISLFCCCLMNCVNADVRPNLVFVIADDCTYWDMECYGGQAKTPHLNRLCAEGMKFTQCYLFPTLSSVVAPSGTMRKLS